MSRKTSPYILGDHWLAFRRDGRSTGIWQIVSYNPETRSNNYRSTHSRDLEHAKGVLRAYITSLPDGLSWKADGEAILAMVADPAPRLSIASGTATSLPEPISVGETTRRIAARSIRSNDTGPLAVPVVPQIFRYWEEHACETVSADKIAWCLRAFLGFVAQDAIGVACTFDDLHRQTIERFRDWSMMPHHYEVKWYGKYYRSRSRGIGPSSFKKRLAILKAALNHAVAEGVVPFIRPITKKVVVIDKQPRTRPLSVAELGAIIGYARSDKPLLNWLVVMLATGCRPGVAMKLIPSEQFDQRFSGTLDLHPRGARITKKRNPIVPVIAPLAEMLTDHAGPWLMGVRPHQIMHRWKLLRQDLGFGPEVVSNTFRHTVASHLSWWGTTGAHITELLGHSVADGSMARYRKYDSAYMASVMGPLTKLWNEAHAEADRWCERYAVVCTSKGRRRVVTKERLAQLDGELARLRYADYLTPQIVARTRTALAHLASCPDWLRIREMGKCEPSREFFRIKHARN